MTFWARPGLRMRMLNGPRTPFSTATMASNSACRSAGTSVLSDISGMRGIVPPSPGLESWDGAVSADGRGGRAAARETAEHCAGHEAGAAGVVVVEEPTNHFARGEKP